MSEHAVIVSFTYSERTLAPLGVLERRLKQAIKDAAVGEYEGRQLASDRTQGQLWMFGPDADALFRAVQPVLAEAACFSRAEATLRYGTPAYGAPARTEPLRY